MNLNLCFKSLSLRTGDSSGGKLLAGCAKFSPWHPNINLSVCPENPKPKKLSMGTMVVKSQDWRGQWGQGTGVGEEMTPKVSSGLQTHVHEGRYFLMGKIHTHMHTLTHAHTILETSSLKIIKTRQVSCLSCESWHQMTVLPQLSCWHYKVPVHWPR